MVAFPHQDDAPLDLPLCRKEKTVKLGGEPYTIKEMMGTQRDQWLKGMGQRMRTDASGKVVGIKDYAGLHSSLISLCLYGPGGDLVPAKVIDEWPASVTSKLFEECQRLNGLGDDASREEEKKD